MAQKQYQSATSGTTRKLSGGTDDRFTKLQIDAFNGGAFAKINIESVLSHTSDAHIRPLCMNNRIEHYVEKQYNAQTLTFKPLTLKEVKALNGTELTQFVTTIYKPLSSSSVSHEDKLNIMRYFEGICPDATTANILVNSSVMTLCVKLAGQMDAPAVFRETAASIMGILVRHTTFIHVDLAKSNVVPNTVKLCKKETDMGVKRKLIACVGEFLFYVAVRPEKERDPWNIDAKEVKEVFLDALLSNDEIYKHYAAKAVENLGSVGDKHVIRFAFCSKDVVEALINVYTDSSPGSKADHMRSSGLCAAIKLTFVEDSLIPVVLNSTKLPTSSYGNLLHNTSIHRTAQLLLAFLNYALIRAMVTTKNPYVASWASLHPESPCLAPCLLSNADAENVLSEIGDRSDELLEGICDGLESYSLSSRGKTLLFATLIGCLGGTTFSRLASSRHVALLDKIMREQDKYVVQCSNVFSNYVSLFISEKLSFVAQKVSSSVTPFYLSALQQLLNMNTLRSMISLQRDAFKSLSECLEKSITNTMYGAYEDAFNAISDRLVQTPEAVVQYYSPIAMYLVKPYTEMLQQKESERRFSAIRYLTSIITPLSSEPRLSKDTIVIRAATSVVNVVIDNFSTLLGEMNPVPSSSVRLLVTCGEWMPKLLVPKLSEDFLKSLFQYLNTAREIDLSPPLNLIYLALFNGGKEEFLTYILQENIVSFIVKSLSNAHSKGIDNVVDACCELAAYLLKKVAGDPTSKNAQHCLELLSNNSIKNIYLPLCSSETKSTAESCACIMYDLTRLSPSAQAEMLSSDGVTTLIWALNSSPLPQVPEFLLKAMRHSVENQKTDIQKINSVDELVTALSNYNSSAGTNKNRNGIVEASKLIKLIKN
ncbi:protein kinase [Angomonas deanei]|uniref:Serine/threonine-protein kinase ULK4/RUNKEL HEAT repeats domain-containing protein n=1 Tax=Angomonas deanei TaxID=59799 RepID=A0A7G2CJ86_9TRYP|nr:protein kinase [Angomonas deanei]CAD2219004.1 hypothetical protein, conserved [Angomonas deanei]|eukprot:EPY30306.1 protein kinase [Angomonas deanei]